VPDLAHRVQEELEAEKVDCVSAVQELLSRACGAIAKDGAFDAAAKAAYTAMFLSQLAAPVIATI
jgi:hypothetical protein